VDKAVLCFNEMFERSGREDLGSSFEVLVVRNKHSACSCAR
jgi:hypothetical protein